MASKEVWGIDIGKSSIKAVKMRQAKDKLEILAVDIIEYDLVEDTEAVDKEEQIRQALIEFQTKNSIKKSDRIYVSIPGQATFNRMITVPAVEPKRIKEIISYEAQQQIPFPIDEVLWDYQIIEEDNKGLEEREVMLFAVRKEIINNFLSNLSAVGMKVEGIQIAPLAIYNFVRYEKPDLEAAVAIDIGAENTDLVIVDNEKLWMRALPAAGNEITKALQKRFNISYVEAEKLKLKSGQTKQPRKIFEVIKPILKDLVGEIHRSVGFYTSTSKEIKLSKMVFLGNATKLNGFKDFFAQNLRYDIEIFSEVSRLHVSPSVNVGLFQSNIATFAVSIGLAIQGLGKSINKIRLLPKEIAAEFQAEKQKPVLAIAVALLAIIPGWEFFNINTKLQEVKSIMKEIGDKGGKRKVNGVWKNPKPSGLIGDILKKQKELKEAKKYKDLKVEAKELCKVGVGRKKFVEIYSALNTIYKEASDKIEKNKSNKIWLLDLTFNELEVSSARGKKTNLDKGRYIKITISLAFKSFKDPINNFKDPVQNRRYVINNFLNALEEYKGRNKKKLFVLEQEQKKIEDFGYISPVGGEESFEKDYYRCTLQLFTKLED